MKILMVDDDPSLVKILSFLLKDEGYDVLSASTGLEALQILQQQWVDMLILDIGLPRVDGFEVCRRVRENESHPDYHALGAGQHGRPRARVARWR